MLFMVTVEFAGVMDHHVTALLGPVLVRFYSPNLIIIIIIREVGSLFDSSDIKFCWATIVDKISQHYFSF